MFPRGTPSRLSRTTRPVNAVLFYCPVSTIVCFFSDLNLCTDFFACLSFIVVFFAGFVSLVVVAVVFCFYFRISFGVMVGKSPLSISRIGCISPRSIVNLEVLFVFAVLRLDVFRISCLFFVRIFICVCMCFFSGVRPCMCFDWSLRVQSLY